MSDDTTPREMTCIVCPNGCTLTVTVDGDAVTVTGNTCPKGEEYGREEVTAPRRTLTAVVRTDSPDWPCVPVKTSEAVPKESIPSILRQIYAMQAPLPVSRGTEVLADAAGTGVAVVCTRSLPPAHKPLRT